MPAPSPRLILALTLVSLAVVLHVGLLTRGTGVQSAVEARLSELDRLAGERAVPLPALVALAVAEGHRAEPRPDPALAGALASALVAASGRVETALAAQFDDPVERRLCLDLWRRNQERWIRLTAR